METRGRIDKILVGKGSEKLGSGARKLVSNGPPLRRFDMPAISNRGYIPLSVEDYIARSAMV
jgi:hypothetical protein